MDSHDEIDDTLLASYLAGHASASERAAVERWAAADPRHAQELEALRRWWDTAGAVPSEQRVDAMWQGLARRMHGASAAPNASDAPARVLRLVPRDDRARRAPTWRRVASIAAAVLVCVTGGSLAWRSLRAPRTPHADVATEQTYATVRGQRASVRLADGTRVELGYASRLRVAFHEAGRRELYLDGEAVFDVVHDARRPFVVHAAHAVTEDIGTVFGVRAYAGDSAVRVVVMSGRVAVRPAVAGARADSAVLGGGMLAMLDARGRIAVEEHADTAASLAWLGNRISFRGERLDAIAAELGRRFDADVRVVDSNVAARRVTVDMPITTLNAVLEAVTLPAGAHLRRAGTAFVIEK